MPTVFRLVPEGESIDLDFDRFRASLPDTFTLDQRLDGLYLSISSPELDDESAQHLADRELDRIFFLTCVRVRAEMCRRTVTATLAGGYRVHGAIPEDTRPVAWTEKWALQLRLWSIAADSPDPLIKALLLFQIIELEYPDTSNVAAYPRYADETIAPHPRTEAKLLRHLVAHAGDARPETAKYLSFLGLPPRLSNLTESNWLPRVADRIPHVAIQARQILQSAA